MGWETPLMEAHAEFICQRKALEDGNEGMTQKEVYYKSYF
jgi:hypothetical protein